MSAQKHFIVNQLRRRGLMVEHKESQNLNGMGFYFAQFCTFNAEILQNSLSLLVTSMSPEASA